MNALLPHSLLCLPVVSKLLNTAENEFVGALQKWSLNAVTDLVPKCTAVQWQALIADTVTKYVSKCLLNKCESSRIVEIVEAATSLALDNSFLTTLKKSRAATHNVSPP